MRILATILCIDCKVVQSYGFSNYKIIGDPGIVVKHLDAWQVDEIVLLQLDNSSSNLLLNLESINKVSTTPITVGGGITSLQLVKELISSGADRVCIQSLAFSNISEIFRISDHFGGQAITLKFDLRQPSRDSLSDWSLFRYDISLIPNILSQLSRYDVDDLFFYNTSADGLIASPSFESFFKSYDLSKYSVILGGGLNPQITAEIYAHLGNSFKDLSLSYSNYFHQKELANISILDSISAYVKHRLCNH